jgi:hypothetical protein
VVSPDLPVTSPDAADRHRLADYEITEIVPTRSSPALAFLVE